ncbi:unnamed protein product [Caenorhabditis auriculariae]|uniref:Zinc finger protein 830 n=1 Tax=Caenorhabditis auriculariae TaxID=2777116 RepID=A0A8S1GZ03_9PELO|nr:unnamed protein product [Caenorhabditis auriculariae]
MDTNLLLLADVAELKKDYLFSSAVVGLAVEERSLFATDDHTYFRNEWHVVDANHDYFHRLEPEEVSVDVEHSYAVPHPAPKTLNDDLIELEENYIQQPSMVCQWGDCTAIASTSAELHDHIEGHVDGSQRQCLWYNCSKKCKEYSHRYLLMRHIRNHSGHTPFVCSHCSNSFKTKERMYLHVRAIHECEVKYRCQVCNAFFKTTSDRSHHIRRIHKKKRFPCIHCNDSFAGPEVLRRHLFKCLPMASNLKLNPLIAKETSNGQIQCLVCTMQVKTKIWTAHVNGKKHRENVEKLKSSVGPKRQNVPTSAAQPPKKKLKEDSMAVTTNEDNSFEGPVPNDFFDEEPLNITTPWQKSRQDEKHGSTSSTVDNLPHGFFDDKKIDGRMKETKELNAKLDAEYDRWKQEISEEQIEEDSKKEQEESSHARQLELERIDEQMAALKRLNELEIQKEKRVAAALERRKQQMNEEMEEEDVGGVDYDFEVNWRSKGIF